MRFFEYIFFKISELSPGTRNFLTHSTSSANKPLHGMVVMVDDSANSASVTRAFCHSNKHRFQTRKNYGVYKEHQQPTLTSLVKKDSISSLSQQMVLKFRKNISWNTIIRLRSVDIKDSTYTIMNRNFKWRGMLKDTEEYVKICQTCQQTKSSHQKPHGSSTACCYSGKQMGRHFYEFHNAATSLSELSWCYRCICGQIDLDYSCMPMSCYNRLNRSSLFIS